MDVEENRANMSAARLNRQRRQPNQVGIWANPMNTIEEPYLAKKLADGLGVKDFATRLRQQDKRLQMTSMVRNGWDKVPMWHNEGTSSRCKPAQRAAAPDARLRRAKDRMALRLGQQ